jgi:hypothetical protein
MNSEGSGCDIFQIIFLKQLEKEMQKPLNSWYPYKNGRGTSEYHGMLTTQPQRSVNNGTLFLLIFMTSAQTVLPH